MGAAQRLVSRIIASPSLRAMQRGMQAAVRRVSGARPHVRFFHQADDPYSQLAAQILPRLTARYAITLSVHPVPPPDTSAAPEAARLAAYAVADAARLAQAYGLVPPGDGPASLPKGFAPAGTVVEGAALRRRLGHYLSGMFHFEGEWYWGLDRLAFLEARLASFRRPEAGNTLVAPRFEAGARTLPTPRRRPQLDMYLSFRSPYTYLAMARTIRLAEAAGADLRLRFVLPMVMRGLPVPLPKRLYIVRDAKREAERLGLPFGHIADPVGAGAERGLAVLHHAIQAGRGPDFAVSFLQGVFAEGIDAATDSGLQRLAGRAGISDDAMKAALADPTWREVAERNREALFALGLWGVPSFQVDAMPAHWGQDRLFMVEDDLVAAGGIQ